ncbi:hypothetical protein M3557_14635 [Bhargavaea ginsengi]|uniref:hypothetical protein n=1 Tax=Bhargavaea ginsengi TaxID=426757 RepID=UPI00203E6406|nr:hypothetical protein [Bhargavaea ginsengi]MCM3089153.1 hypothetical protein [Bhargavaea ginsengi]
MSRKSEPAKSTASEIVERSPIASNGSIKREVAAFMLKAAAPVVIEKLPVLLDKIIERFDDDREERKNARQNRRAIWEWEFEIVKKSIEKEVAKEEDYNQEEIDKHYEHLNKLKQECDVMEEKADGFTKGLFKSIKELATSKQ